MKRRIDQDGGAINLYSRIEDEDGKVVHDDAKVVNEHGTQIGVVSRDGRILDRNEKEIGQVD